MCGGGGGGGCACADELCFFARCDRTEFTTRKRESVGEDSLRTVA